MQLDDVSYLITQKLENTVETTSPLVPTCKAISALLPFAARQEQNGTHATLSTLLYAVRTSDGFIWNRVAPAFFNDASYLNTLLVSPYVDWCNPLLADRGSMVALWAAAALGVPYTEEVGRSVVDVLLHVSMFSFLRSRIPVGIWGWLEKRPPLPPRCRGRGTGTEESVVRHIRGLGDIKILKSYLLLVWSEWDVPRPTDFSKTWTPTRWEFSRTEMRGDREDLIRHLDNVLERLDRGLGYLRKQKPRLRSSHVREAKKAYGRIREMLLEVDGGAVGAQTRMSTSGVLFP